MDEFDFGTENSHRPSIYEYIKDNPLYPSVSSNAETAELFKSQLERIDKYMERIFDRLSNYITSKLPNAILGVDSDNEGREDVFIQRDNAKINILYSNMEYRVNYVFNTDNCNLACELVHLPELAEECEYFFQTTYRLSKLYRKAKSSYEDAKNLLVDNAIETFKLNLILLLEQNKNGTTEFPIFDSLYCVSFESTKTISIRVCCDRELFYFSEQIYFKYWNGDYTPFYEKERIDQTIRYIINRTNTCMVKYMKYFDRLFKMMKFQNDLR